MSLAFCAHANVLRKLAITTQLTIWTLLLIG